MAIQKEGRSIQAGLGLGARPSKIILLGAIWFLMASYSQCQELHEPIKSSTKEIRSISYLDDDFSDLSFLKEKLQGRRVVLLGEGTHLDGSTLDAKNRMIRFLHEEMGYNVLLIESGMFGMGKMWEDVMLGKDSLVGALGLNDNWAFLSSGGCGVTSDDRDLGRYASGFLKPDADTLFIQGMDISKSAQDLAFTDDLEALLTALDENIKKSAVYEDFEKLTLKNVFFQPISQAIIDQNMAIEKNINIDSLVFYGNRIILFIQSKSKSLSIEKRRYSSFMCQAIRSFIGYNDWVKNRSELDNGTFSYHKIRDKYMAENTIWFIDNYFPNEKIIVSASTYHISRNLTSLSSLPEKLKEDDKPLGQYLWDRYQDSIYSIAFIAYQGTRGNSIAKETKLEKRHPKGIENQLHKLGLKYGYLDLSECQKFNNKDGFFLNLFFENIRSDWKKNYDGLFFIDKMEPFRIIMYGDRLKYRSPYSPRKDWYR
jgi:erythromycin esterase